MSKEAELSTKDLQSEAIKLFGGYLKKDISTVSLNALGTIVGLEREAREVSHQLKKEVPSLLTTMSESLAYGLDLFGSKIQEQDKGSVQQIFSDTVMRNIAGIPNALYSNMKEGKGILFNGMMHEQVVDVLDSILEFKKSIDSIYPGLSDILVSAAAAGITAGVTAISPSAAVALKASGVIDIAADFLKTENLQNTVTKLRDGLEAIQHDKELNAIKQKSDKTIEVSKQTGIASSVMNKIGLSTRALNAIADDLSKPAIRTFISDVATYAKEVLPISKDQISENVSAIKGQMLETMRKNGVPESAIKQLDKEIDTRFEKAEKLLRNSLDQNKNFFDKVTVQQEGGKMIMDIADGLAKDLKELVPNSKELQKAVTTAVATEVTKRITGPIEKLQTAMKDPEVKKLAKQEMGANIRSDLSVERTQKLVNQSTGKNVGPAMNK